MPGKSSMVASTPQGIERLRHIIECYCRSNGVSWRSLSLKVGDNQGLVKDLMNRVTRPRRETLSKLAEAMQVSPRQLVGSGPMPPFARTKDATSPADDMVRFASGEIDRTREDDEAYPVLCSGAPGELSLARKYVEEHLASSDLDHVVLFRAMADFDDETKPRGGHKLSIRKDDLMLVDISVKIARNPGLYLFPEALSPEIKRLVNPIRARVVGRVLWVAHIV